MIRNILAVIAGYAIFVVSSLMLFQLSGQKPHAPAAVTFQILTAFYGALFSFLSGWVVQLIAKTGNLKINYVLAAIIAGFAAFSLFKTTGTHYTQLLAIIIFAPVSVLGGLFYLRRVNKHSKLSS